MKENIYSLYAELSPYSSLQLWITEYMAVPSVVFTMIIGFQQQICICNQKHQDQWIKKNHN
jgi:hypothetical protein